MADSDGSPQRDDCHHRRSRSRSPVYLEWVGETPAEREERRLAEAVVLVGPPAEHPRATTADTGPSTQEPEPAEVTALAVEAPSSAAPPQEGASDAWGAETAAPASHAAAPTAAPGTPPTRGVLLAQEPGASPSAAAAAGGSGEGARGVATAAPASRATASAGHAAGEVGEGPRTGHRRLAGGCRSSSSGQGGCEVTRPRQPHPHPHQPSQAVRPQALPPWADAARPPPGARALAARRHAAAAAKAAGRPARDPGRRGRRAGRAACQPQERGAGDRKRQGNCPGHTRQGARAQQRRRTERGQRTARLRAGSREGARAREGRAGARAGRPGAWSGARDGGRAGRPGRG